MYWRSGAGSMLLWISSLTLAMSAFAAATKAGSPGAAWCLLTVAALLAPPVQEAIARWRNPMAPRKAAVTSALALLPLGLGLVLVDGAAHLDTEARRLGFTSGGEWARARDLRLGTPDALKAHDAAERRKVQERWCGNRGERLLLFCFEASHQKAALAWVEARLGGGELEGVLRDGSSKMRKAYIEVDKGCSDFLDRIDETAVPAILRERATAMEIAAAAWAAQFSAAELERLTARAKPGTSFLSTGEAKVLDQKLATLTPAVENRIDRAFAAWARRLVLGEPSWRSFMNGRTPLTECKPAKEAGY